jgi:hypothetical protein
MFLCPLQRALETGMTTEEIQKMLRGIIEDVPDDEVTAVMFAQHYADTGETPPWNHGNA